MFKTSLARRTPLLVATVAAAGFAGVSTHALAEPTIGQRTDRAIEKTGNYLSDSALTAKVKTALIAENNLESMKIDVESSEGVVTLTGQVPDKASITLAGNVAQKVDGVRHLHNKLEAPAS